MAIRLWQRDKGQKTYLGELKVAVPNSETPLAALESIVGDSICKDDKGNITLKE